MLVLPTCKHFDGSQITFDFCPIQFGVARFSIRNAKSINSKANSSCKGKFIMDVGQYDNCTIKSDLLENLTIFETAAIIALMACKTYQDM